MAAAEVFDYYSSSIEKLRDKDLIHQDKLFEGSVTRQPVGVVGVITAFNYPLLLMAWKVAPALAAGNCVVVKPSPTTPFSTLFFAHLSQQIIPPGVFNVLLGDDAIGRSLIDHPLTDMVTFTGSTTVGKQIAQSCAKSFKRNILELGGSNSAIVFPDCNIEEAASIIVEGAFSNMGQNCCAIARVYAHKSILDQLTKIIVNLTCKLKVGNPFCESTQFSSLGTRDLTSATRAGYERIKNSLSKISPTNVAFFGHDDPAQFLIGPIIATNISDDHEIVQDEVFGPVLCIMEG
jgi:acyl-CoA reductase-like NAD-dependent aldehyde dehydrogenase